MAGKIVLEIIRLWLHTIVMNLSLLELDQRTNSCIGVNTRELNKELYTK